jgi:hypothetical protein
MEKKKETKSDYDKNVYGTKLRWEIKFKKWKEQ